MSDFDDVPVAMDLEQLQAEILSGPPEAALPCNLSDRWLHQLGANLEYVLSDASEEAGHLAGPLAIVIHILFGKNGDAKSFAVSEDDLFQHCKDLQIECGLEEVSRKTDIKATPATLETIFSNRTVGFTENGSVRA